MGNLVTLSAEELDNRRAPTSTAELPTERDNDAALVLGARPNQEQEPRGTSHVYNTLRIKQATLNKQHEKNVLASTSNCPLAMQPLVTTLMAEHMVNCVIFTNVVVISQIVAEEMEIYPILKWQPIANLHF